MFGLKNNLNKEKTPDEPSINLTQKNALNIDDMPIRTMINDLAKLKNPSLHNNIPASEKKIPKNIPENLTPKQKSSPFLTEDANSSWNERSILKEKNNYTETNSPIKIIQPEKKEPENNPLLGKKEAPSPINANSFGLKNEPTKKINWKIVALFGTSLILIFMLAIAGYFFWQRKLDQKNSTLTENITDTTNPTTKNPPEETTSPIIEQPLTPALSYSQENPNYLPIVPTDINPENTKLLLKKYAQKVAEEGYVKPVEFILTDEKNNPLTFKNFSAKIGLKLSPAITNNLSDYFSLFIYNDNTAFKFGLLIDSKNDQELTNSLSTEEKNLADEINPLFFVDNYGKDKLFYNNEYKGVKIRYQNIISPENLSVDYAITKNKLVIGTTKKTMYELIDWLLKP